MHVTKPVQLFQDHFSLPLARKSSANAYFLEVLSLYVFIIKILQVVYVKFETLLGT